MPLCLSPVLHIEAINTVNKVRYVQLHFDFRFHGFLLDNHTHTMGFGDGDAIVSSITLHPFFTPDSKPTFSQNPSIIESWYVPDCLSLSQTAGGFA